MAPGRLRRRPRSARRPRPGSPPGWLTFPRRGSSSSVAPARYATAASSSSSARPSTKRRCGGSSSGRRTTSPTPTSPPVARSSTAQLVLVCGHGTRDACCALRGSAVHGALAADLEPDSLWISSHQGGHRFAANVLVLPGGIHLGRVAPEDASRVVGDALAGRISLGHYRGRTAYSAREQAAEAVVRKAAGLVSLADLDPRGRRRRARPLHGSRRPRASSAPRGDHGTDGAGELRRRAVAAEAARRDARLAA